MSIKPEADRGKCQVQGQHEPYHENLSPSRHLHLAFHKSQYVRDEPHRKSQYVGDEPHRRSQHWEEEDRVWVWEGIQAPREHA